MPKERDIQTPGGVVYTADGIEREENTVTVKKVDASGNETEEQVRARFARIMERGYMQDRFFVDLPPDLHGEWCANDPFELERMTQLGFTDGSEYVKNRTMHHSGSKPVNADVVYMIQPMREHLLWLKMRQERFDESNKVGKHRNKEEAEYLKEADTLRNDKTGGVAIPLTSDSNSIARQLS